MLITQTLGTKTGTGRNFERSFNKPEGYKDARTEADFPLANNCIRCGLVCREPPDKPLPFVVDSSTLPLTRSHISQDDSYERPKDALAWPPGYVHAFG